MKTGHVDHRWGKWFNGVQKKPQNIIQKNNKDPVQDESTLRKLNCEKRTALLRRKRLFLRKHHHLHLLLVTSLCETHLLFIFQQCKNSK